MCFVGSDVRIPESEVERLGREYQGVHFTDGGYYGMLTVHHNLHCLVRDKFDPQELKQGANIPNRSAYINT